jgi:hypothetical protein
MHSPPDHPAAETSIVRHADLPLIIAEWEALSREEPWHVDPHRYGIDSLHEAIAAVLEVATWGGTGRFTAERLVRSAAAHGEQRRAQGVNDDSLFREYHALRTALWRFLQRASPRGPEAIAEILRVDVAIGVATTIALRGYHRGDLAVGTSWEADVLKQIEAVSRNLADLLHEGARS